MHKVGGELNLPFSVSKVGAARNVILESCKHRSRFQTRIRLGMKLTFVMLQPINKLAKAVNILYQTCCYITILIARLLQHDITIVLRSRLVNPVGKKTCNMPGTSTKLVTTSSCC